MLLAEASIRIRTMKGVGAGVEFAQNVAAAIFEGCRPERPTSGSSGMGSKKV